MRVLLAILISVISFSKLSATIQIPDKIIINNKEYDLLTFPLEKYFEKHESKRPDEKYSSTALWRSYVATFEIIDNQLFVKDIEIEVSTGKWKSVINKILPTRKERLVTWYSGFIILGHGEFVDLLERGNTYENYVLIEIKNGTSIQSKDFDYKTYEVFKTRQFEVYKQSKDYIKEVKKLKKQGWDQKDIDDILRYSIVEYTDRFLVE